MARKRYRDTVERETYKIINVDLPFILIHPLDNSQLHQHIFYVLLIVHLSIFISVINQLET